MNMMLDGRRMITSLAVLLSLTACGLFNDPTDDPVIDERLLDVIWRVDSIQTSEGTRFVSRLYEQMTIQFSEQMEVTGHAPCNDYEGVYSIPKNGSIEISALNMAQDTCIGNLKAIEEALIQALTNVTSYTLGGGELDLHDRDRKHIISISIGSVDQALFRDLLDVTWKADSLQTQEEKIVFGDTSATIQFNKRLRVEGFNACNGYEGIYSNRERGIIAVDILAVTANACPRRLALLSAYFNNVIMEATTYDLRGSRFTMHDSSRQNVLYFSHQ